MPQSPFPLFPRKNEKREITQTEWDKGIWEPGAFKLDHLQPIKPFLLLIFSIFWLSCPKAHFLYSPGKMRKGKSPNLSETKVFGCLGHSNWTICSQLHPFCLEFFHNFTFLPQSPFPLLPRKNEKKEITQTEWDKGIWEPGAFKLDHLQPIKPFCWEFFPYFYFHAPEPISFIPQKKWEKGNLPTWVR